MITAGLTVAAASLLAAGYAVAATAGLFVCAVLLTVLAVAGARASLRKADPPHEPAPVVRRPDFPGYDHLAAAVSWCGVSRHAWDCDMRPILVRLLRNRSDGRAALGDELWPLADPSLSRSGDRDAPGPTRKTLERILDRLEAAR
ncbi:hypothetical protein G3I59_24930 [Amycolatopsis rubida]|uniref:Uncharacterized protein n=1 Tax=Amycolatopsis rubida TaxID=112413 RepID=A0ABX0BY67_9PSEU|nr:MULTISPECIES: hypothetical protein [Amycolatopsis]MYW93769.1 hypothetical protein [Amycolatopsis rubida]NEC58758.1 hypothetical protein [Amycolatopsis rubida]OAP22951.1 hypothetical protein A4R44_06413 [Amycolatopsis sp. M39]